MKLTRLAGAIAVALAAVVPLAQAAGVFPGFPTVTSPTGQETIPADTNTTQGVPPATVLFPSSTFLNGSGNKNALIGGDFATNLWQRGTTFSSLTPTTATMTADRWYTFSTGNTVTITKQSGATDSSQTFGMLSTMRVNRPSGTNVTPICVGQVLDQKASARFFGNGATFSFVAQPQGTGFSPLGGNITASIAAYTAADSATPGTNTGTFAAGTITNFTTVGTNTISLGNTAAAAVFARYSVTGAVPTAIAGSNVTGVGVQICFTPAASTGTANDWFEFGLAQLEVQSGSASVPTFFERRTQGLESELAQYYTTGGGLGTEVNGAFYQAGGCQASGNANFGIIFPVPMRVAPTAATSTLTAGGYSIKTAAAATAIGTITFPAATVFGVTLNSNAACTSTLPYQLVGTNTTGLILFSAEP